MGRSLDSAPTKSSNAAIARTSGSTWPRIFPWTLSVLQSNRPEASKHRYGPTVVVAASIITPVRLAREDISTRSPRIVAGIGNSVQLAKDILDLVRRKFRTQAK